MNVTILAPYVPHDRIDHAGGAYLLAHVRGLLARGIRVRLVAPASSAVLIGEVPPGLEVHVVNVQSSRSVLAQGAEKLANIREGLTPGASFLKAFRTDATCLAWLIRADVVELQWPYLLPLVLDVRRAAPGRPVVAIEHDLASDVFSSTARNGSTRAIRLRHRLVAKRVHRRELAYLRLCSKVFVFSGRDRQNLLGWQLETPIRVIAPSIDSHVRVSEHSEGRKRVLFVGAMHLAGNAEGMRWFLATVWPLIRLAQPEAELVIAGAQPPSWLTTDPVHGIRVTGYVQNLGAEYAQADVFIAPPFSGAGLKFKVGQAMLYGLPVVLSDLARSGFEGAPDEALKQVSADPAEWASAVVGLLADPIESRKAGLAGRRWALGEFDLERSLDEIAGDYAALTGGRDD